MFIGYDKNLYPVHFHGSIDDVRIYDRALSASEVAALYQLESALPAGSVTLDKLSPELSDLLDGNGKAKLDKQGKTIQMCRNKADAKADSNGCEVCDPKATQNGWTVLSPGTACSEDGQHCLPGACKGGKCEVQGVKQGYCFVAMPGATTSTCLADGTTNPQNDCQHCGANKSQTKWVVVDAGKTCKKDDIACTVELRESLQANLSNVDG